MLNEHENHLGYSLRADYYILRAELGYLNTELNDYLNQNNECLHYLDLAKKELLDRWLSFLKINEFSQGSIAPYFSSQARIFALRAKSILFHPHLWGQEDIGLKNVLFLIQNARVNAARDGNSDYYGKLSLFQSCCYLMENYLPNNNKDEDEEVYQNRNFKFAKNLIDHAIICFADSSDRAYQSYLTGLIDESESVIANKSKNESLEDIVEKPDLGSNVLRNKPQIITNPPTLNVLYPAAKKLENEAKNSVELIPLDVKYLRLKSELSEAPVFLFGQNSAYYYFTKGFYLVCHKIESSNNHEDFLFEKN